MDLDLAISAHREWKERLEIYLSDPDQSLSPESVADDRACELGAWLIGDGQAHHELPAHQRLVAAHAAFHQAAADIVRKANRGVPVAAAVALGSGSDYARRSTDVIRAIMMLRDTLRRFGTSV